MNIECHIIRVKGKKSQWIKRNGFFCTSDTVDFFQLFLINFLEFAMKDSDLLFDDGIGSRSFDLDNLPHNKEITKTVEINDVSFLTFIHSI